MIFEKFSKTAIKLLVFSGPSFTVNHKMSASNDELLFYAAKSGDVTKVKELLLKGTGTGYRDEVS
jgi:hypothetical protein